MKNPIYDNYVVRTVKITETENYIKALCKVYHPKLYQLQKKYINWAFRSSLKNKFAKDSELTVMAAINKNISIIGDFKKTKFGSIIPSQSSTLIYDMLINKLPFKLLRINNRPNLFPDTIKHKMKYIN